MSRDPFAAVRTGRVSARAFSALCVAIDEAEELGRAAAAPVAPTALGPESLEEYVGQERLKAKLLIGARAAMARNEKAPATLLVGVGGSGKTTLCRMVAAMLDQPLVPVTRPITDLWKLAAILGGIADGGVAFFDELHVWSTKQVHVLMQLIEDGEIDMPSGGKRAFPGVTVMAATTEPQMLFGPLVSRFAVEKMEPYTPDQMSQMVQGFAGRAGVELDDEIAGIFARASAGQPRQARRLVEAARDWEAAGMEPEAPLILSYCGVALDGLTDDHLSYLEVLHAANGRAGLSTLAGRMGAAEQTVRAAEWLLLERGYVELLREGRVLTPAGEKRLRA